jgi:hypothetical protein
MAKTIRNLESLIPPSVKTETVNGTNHWPGAGWNNQQNTPERAPGTGAVEPRKRRHPDEDLIA